MPGVTMPCQHHPRSKPFAKAIKRGNTYSPRPSKDADASREQAVQTAAPSLIWQLGAGWKRENLSYLSKLLSSQPQLTGEGQVAAISSSLSRAWIWMGVEMGSAAKEGARKEFLLWETFDAPA